MGDDPQQVWSRPHESSGAPPPPMARGHWWYQYPNGQWVWFNSDTNSWVPVEVKHSAPTQWWVYAIVVIAVVVTIASIVAVVSQLPEVIEEQQRILEEEQNV